MRGSDSRASRLKQLLRKARIHTVAALRANETSNLHSLAVQMRPVLECAGQVVFRFRTLFIAPDVLTPEKAAAMLGTRVCAARVRSRLSLETIERQRRRRTRSRTATRRTSMHRRPHWPWRRHVDFQVSVTSSVPAYMGTSCTVPSRCSLVTVFLLSLVAVTL